MSDRDTLAADFYAVGRITDGAAISYACGVLDLCDTILEAGWTGHELVAQLRALAAGMQTSVDEMAAGATFDDAAKAGMRTHLRAVEL